MDEQTEARMRAMALTARACERESAAMLARIGKPQRYDKNRWDGMERNRTVLRARTPKGTLADALIAAPFGWLVARYQWTHKQSGQTGIGYVAAVDWEALALWFIGLLGDEMYEYELPAPDDAPLTV